MSLLEGSRARGAKPRHPCGVLWQPLRPRGPSAARAVRSRQRQRETSRAHEAIFQLSAASCWERKGWGVTRALPRLARRAGSVSLNSLSVNAETTPYKASSSCFEALNAWQTEEASLRRGAGSERHSSLPCRTAVPLGARGRPSRDPNPPRGKGLSAQSRHLTPRRRPGGVWCGGSRTGPRRVHRPLQASPGRPPLPTACVRACRSARSKPGRRAGGREGEGERGRPAAPHSAAQRSPGPALGTRQRLTCPSRRSRARPSPRACPSQLGWDHSAAGAGGQAEKSPSHRLLAGGRCSSASPPAPPPLAWARRDELRPSASSAPRRGGRGASLLSGVASAGGGAGGRAGSGRAAPRQGEPEVRWGEGKGARWRRAWGAGPWARTTWTTACTSAWSTSSRWRTSRWSSSTGRTPSPSSASPSSASWPSPSPGARPPAPPRGSPAPPCPAPWVPAAPRPRVPGPGPEGVPGPGRGPGPAPRERGRAARLRRAAVPPGGGLAGDLVSGCDLLCALQAGVLHR